MATAAAPSPQIHRSQILSLAEAGISETVLEKWIVDDPTVLDLGDVAVVETQRRQDKAGRLDLLLEDSDGEVRYEVELMLGPIDESHLVRAIEYWDIERRRYPGYEHRCVIVAEDITSRFLNVIHLFSGSIPITAIQVNCIKVEGMLALAFFRLLESTKLRRDDQTDVKAKATDRNDWLTRVGQHIVEIADECVAIINSTATRKRTLNYNKQFIGLLEGNQPNNFVFFRPKKSFMRVKVRLADLEEWLKKLQQTGLDVRIKDDKIDIDVTPQTFRENKALITEVLKHAVKEDES
jgi:hypothetical protein